MQQATAVVRSHLRGSMQDQSDLAVTTIWRAALFLRQARRGGIYPAEFKGGRDYAVADAARTRAACAPKRSVLRRSRRELVG
jgi:hypothetical protein